ncbi:MULTISPECIES: glutathione S-transferase N-terminal domain-containing protein [unclassified Thioalkalivibrio]|uniref:glutathione S-transferase N-terminal domain-containing protein n=1 Tax=unclassified Thioalkalivibrio TaxID=2621013 RepID=UPI0003821B14|nr:MULTISPECIES: glutathione S-transferase N-terminal domain-containing protein [unclassified Thioalkalivibrio]
MRFLIRWFFRGVRLILTPFMLIGERLSRPRGIERDPADQARVDEQTRHLALYHFPACPFCIRARRTMQRLSLDIELRNAQAAGPHREELQTEGGKLQVPCLRIEEPDGQVRWLYESDAIGEYLRERFDPNRPDGRSGDAAVSGDSRA